MHVFFITWFSSRKCEQLPIASVRIMRTILNSFSICYIHITNKKTVNVLAGLASPARMLYCCYHINDMIF